MVRGGGKWRPLPFRVYFPGRDGGGVAYLRFGNGPSASPSRARARNPITLAPSVAVRGDSDRVDARR